MASEKDPSGKATSSSGTGSGSKDGSSEGSAAGQAKPGTGGAAKPASASSKRPVTIDLKPEKVAAKPSGSAAPGSEKNASTSKAAADKGTAAPRPSSTPEASAKAGPKSTDEAEAPKATESKSGAGISETTPAGATAKDSDPKPAGSGKADLAPTDNKPAERRTEPTGSAAAGKSPAPGTGAADQSSGSFSGRPEPASSGGGAVGLLVAALMGGIVVLGGGYALHASGLVTIEGSMDADARRVIAAAEDRIGDLERQLAELAGSSGMSDVAGLVSGLETRLGDVETALHNTGQDAVSNLRPDLEAVKADVADLRTTIAAQGSGAAGSATGSGGIDLESLQARVAAMETALETVKSEASETAGSASALEGSFTSMSGSLDGVSASIATLKTEVADLENRLQNTEATAKAAQTAVSTSDVSLKTLADSQARATETLSSLSADIQSVENANDAALTELRAELEALSKRVAGVEATMGDATAREVAARALSVSALKSAVDSGQPFETELAAVKAGLPPDTDVSALEGLAKTGVAPTSVLIAEFPAVARQIHASISEPDRSGDVLTSLLSGARSIVTVRGPGDADGSGPAAALRRMENAVAAGDLPGALTAYDDLPDGGQAAGADWAARAKARIAVNQLTDQASQEVLSELARRGS